jgi:hypothetical protein
MKIKSQYSVKTINNYINNSVKVKLVVIYLYLIKKLIKK